jgi:hypothetical protein
VVPAIVVLLYTDFKMEFLYGFEAGMEALFAFGFSLHYLEPGIVIGEFIKVG